MRTFCGLTGYKTLPNKFKSSAYSPSKATKNKEQPQSGKTSIFSLPPRPKVSRSFSFSDSETASKGGKHQEHHHHQHQNKNEKVLGRTQSVYGLQTSQPLSWIDSLTSSSTYPTCRSMSDENNFTTFLNRAIKVYCLINVHNRCVLDLDISQYVS